MAAGTFGDELDKTTKIQLSVTGRTSGRKIARPVWFVRQDDSLYLLPVYGSDTQWYKNIIATHAVELSADRATYSADATPLTDSSSVQHVIDSFLAKYGEDDVRDYYPKTDVAVEVPLG